MMEPAGKASPSVFLSFQSAQRDTADLLAVALRAHGIKCWVSFDPDAIGPGQQYYREIPAAIEACDALILLFSPEADGSPHVRSEIELAFSRQKPILPIRIGQVALADLDRFQLAYFLRTSQFIDWLGERDKTIATIVRQVHRLCEGPQPEGPPVQRQQPRWLRATSAQLRRYRFVIGGVALLGALCLGVVYADAHLTGPAGFLGVGKPRFSTTNQVQLTAQTLNLGGGTEHHVLANARGEICETIDSTNRNNTNLKNVRGMVCHDFNGHRADFKVRRDCETEIRYDSRGDTDFLDSGHLILACLNNGTLLARKPFVEQDWKEVVTRPAGWPAVSNPDLRISTLEWFGSGTGGHMSGGTWLMGTPASFGRSFLYRAKGDELQISYDCPPNENPAGCFSNPLSDGPYSQVLLATDTAWFTRQSDDGIKRRGKLDIATSRIALSSAIPDFDAIFDRDSQSNSYPAGLSIIALGKINDRETMLDWQGNESPPRQIVLERQNGAELGILTGKLARIPDRCLIAIPFSVAAQGLWREHNYLGLFSTVTGQMVAVAFDGEAGFQSSIQVRGEYLFYQVENMVSRVRMTGSACA